MSIHNLPTNIDMELARFLLQKHLRLPNGVVYGNGLNQPPTAIEFAPDLTAEEQATLSNIAQRYNDAKADYEQYETYRSNLKTYLGLASPTLAQSAAALKVTIRVIVFMMDIFIRQRL
jgi:hypothetical protein